MDTIPAIRIEKTGSAEVMTLKDVVCPEPGPTQVRVRHAAIGVNFIDTYHRSGLYPVPMPSGIGLEAAGTIDAVGSAVTTRSVGDRVAFCTGPIGAYAGAHLVEASRVVALADGIADDVAAASMLKGLTVQYLIRQIHPCGPQDTVLFHAAAGGVGQLAVQWLASLGTRVIATAGGAEKCALARELGAHETIDYRSEDVASRVRDLTDGRGVSVVFDGVGKDTWLGSLDSLSPRGLMVSFGNASGPVPNVDIGILAAKGSLFVTRPTLGHYTATPQALQAAADDFFGAILKGAIKVKTPTAYPLSNAVQAHRELEGRRTTGSIILKP